MVDSHLDATVQGDWFPHPIEGVEGVVSITDKETVFVPRARRTRVEWVEGNQLWPPQLSRCSYTMAFEARSAAVPREFRWLLGGHRSHLE